MLHEQKNHNLLTTNFNSISREAIAVLNIDKKNFLMIYWDDNTESELNIKSQKLTISKNNFDINGIRKNQSPYPKKIVAFALVGDTNYAIWDDNTYSDFRAEWTNFEFSGPLVALSVDRTLVTACRSRSALKATDLFWSDGTYSTFNWDSNKLTHENIPQTSWAPGWPAGRELISVIDNGGTLDFFWEDGTCTIYSWVAGGSLTEGLTRPVDIAIKYPGWPQRTFNPALHEIKDIRINFNMGHQNIRIDGHNQMPVPINVWVKVRDKTTLEYIKIGDRYMNGDTLIMFYDYQLGPEKNRRSYLDFDGVGGLSFSKEWKISRLPFSDQKIAGASYSEAAPSDGSGAAHVGGNPSAVVTEGDSYFDGWNRFTYYVTTAKPTTIKQLAARVGVAGAYQYTGSDGLDEYASVTASKG